MATVFLDPGGDATFVIGTIANATGLWASVTGTPSVATDFVHGTHVKSTKFANGDYVSGSGLAASSTPSGRVSFWIYLNALPNADAKIFGLSGVSDFMDIALTSAGTLKSVFWSVTGSISLSTGQWYHLCFTYNITSGTVNSFKTFVNGTLGLTVTNKNITSFLPTTGGFDIGNGAPDTGNAVLDMRLSDIYADDSNSMTDTGNIWVTAKRPVSNGSSNGFTTQIGSGGSGYGTGHSPQVNERPISQTNGWSIGSASLITEEYTIEAQSVGDINITGSTIVDFLGWICTDTANNATQNIIVAGSATNINNLASTPRIFKVIAGSTTYPAGNTDIGMNNNSQITTTRLFECGIVIAFIPANPVNSNFLAFM